MPPAPPPHIHMLVLILGVSWVRDLLIPSFPRVTTIGASLQLLNKQQGLGERFASALAQYHKGKSMSKIERSPIDLLPIRVEVSSPLSLRYER